MWKPGAITVCTRFWSEPVMELKRAEAEENLHEGESLPWDFYADTLLEAVEEILKSNDLEKGTKQET